MGRRVFGGVVLGLLASASVWCASSHEPGLRTARWGKEPPRLLPEVLRRPLAAQGGPEPASFIRSIEITRPSAVEVMPIASTPGEPLARVDEPPPVCDAPPRTLLRAGCPEAPPEVGPCAEEGQDCRYPTANACTARYQCLYGLWSPLAVVCPDAQQGQLLAGSGTCEANTPVADAPCADEGLSCVHQPCGFGGQQVVAECRCGRWYQRWQDCPITR